MQFGILMDPISEINVQTDSSFAMLLEAQRRGWNCYYLEPQDVWLQDGIVWGNLAKIHVEDRADQWYALESPVVQPLVELDLLMMRKDPPFDMQYIYLTYLLEQAEENGLIVFNKPASLRDSNEKLFATKFPQCCPKTLVTSQTKLIREFLENESAIVVKPLGGKGGHSIFRIAAADPNLNVILETATQFNTVTIMVQRFIPEIREGDKRVLMLNGNPVPYAFARVPAAGDFRGNVSSGATGHGKELTERDRWICEQVGPTLREKGLVFVGLDIIGDYLTEINVTSPTCVRELDEIYGLNIMSDFFDSLDEYIGKWN